MSGEPLSPVPDQGGNNKAAANESPHKVDPKTEKETKQERRQGRRFFGFTKSQLREFAGYFILIAWLWYDLIDAHGHIVKLCVLAFGLTVAQGLAASFINSRSKAVVVWVLAEIAVSFAVYLNSRPLPKPEFVLAIQFGESPAGAVILTNNFLFEQQTIKYADLPNGMAAFHTYVDGCLCIPVQQGESNKVFTVGVLNVSPVIVNDLQVIVGFPDAWQVGFDSSKWRRARASFDIPKWTVTATNVQFLEFQCPQPVFAGDLISCPPLTNTCVPEYIGNTFKGGFIQLIVRCTDFEKVMAANTLFVPVGTNFVRPFVTRGVFDKEGKIHLSPTPQEIEQATNQ